MIEISRSVGDSDDQRGGLMRWAKLGAGEIV
jgi:hypothetical protein